ncbi:hypothetical protein [Streptomyces sp. NPDC049585]|uniref:uridine kinase family protein n=1 Tax=Streptomyces sp. NPDC049585 TaxID=3155154 RepID=UPI0034159453
MERIARAVAGRALVGREVGNGCALIALNGRAGDGKTTLAALRAEHLGGPDCAAVVHGDDFLQPTPDDQRFSLDTVEDYRGYFDWPRLRNQVLAPLTGWPVAYERYDAAANTVPPGSPRPLQPHGTVVVEGVLTARPELPVCYDLVVLVDTRTRCACAACTPGDATRGARRGSPLVHRRGVLSGVHRAVRTSGPRRPGPVTSALAQVVGAPVVRST